jgi:para-nitrobenzyl esterase
VKRNYGTPRAGVWLAAGLIVLATLVAGTSAASASAAPAAPGTGLVVTTADGALRGTTAGPVDEFLGIPYAAPPVGPLRWRPPQPAAPWTGIRDATAFAPHCPQPPSGFGVASTSENCLYLNVYTPAGATASARSLPVMVWIHGGAFIAGESDDYDPAGLVRHGVIVVCVQHAHCPVVVLRGPGHD